MGEVNINASNVTVSGPQTSAYRNAQSDHLPGMGPMVNSLASLILPMVFNQTRDARSWSAFGGSGSFRPSESYMRAEDLNERARAMGVVAQDDVASQVRRITDEYAAQQAAAGVQLTEVQKRDYANSAEVRKQASQAARENTVRNETKAVENFTQLYYATSLMGKAEEDLTPDTRERLMKDARERAIKTRETIAGNPLASAGVMFLARQAEKYGGAGITNIDPKFFMGGGVFDALRGASGSAPVAPGVATDLTKSIAEAMFNEDGTVNYDFARGRSALQAIDVFSGASQRGDIDLTSVADGRAGSLDSAGYMARKDKILSDLKQMNGVQEAMEELFGPGGSFAELIDRVDTMTSGALQTVSKDRVERLVRDVRYVAVTTGRTAEQMEGMLTAGTQYAVRNGLSGEVGTRLTLDAMVRADAAVKMRGESRFTGARSREELTGDILEDAVEGMQSNDAVAAASMIATARMVAEGVGIEGAGTMSGDKLFDVLADTAGSHGATQEQVDNIRKYGTAFRAIQARVATQDQRQMWSAAGARGGVVALDSVYMGDRIDLTTNYELDRELRSMNMQSELPGLIPFVESAQAYDKKRQIVTAAVSHTLAARNDFTGVDQAEEYQAEFARHEAQYTAAYDLLMRNPPKGKTQAEMRASAVKLLTSKEAEDAGITVNEADAGYMLSMFDKMAGPHTFPGEKAGIFGIIDRDNVQARERREQDAARNEVWQLKDDMMKAQGIGSGSLFQKFVANLMQDPTQDDAKAVGPLITGEVQAEEFKTVFDIGRRHAEKQIDISRRVEAREITPEQALAEREAATIAVTDEVAKSEQARKELAELDTRKSTGDTALDTQKVIEDNTRRTAEATSAMAQQMGADVGGKDAKTAKGESADAVAMLEDVALTSDKTAAAVVVAGAAGGGAGGGRRVPAATMEGTTHVDTYLTASLLGNTTGRQDGGPGQRWHSGDGMFLG